MLTCLPFTLVVVGGGLSYLLAENLVFVTGAVVLFGLLVRVFI